jgi:hypothetical protein
MPTVSCFLGIGAAFPPDDVAGVRDAVNAALRGANLPEYAEPDDPAEVEAKFAELHKLARSKSDIIDDAVKPLGRMIMRARGDAAGPFRDFSVSPEQFFVPGDFSERLEVPTLPGRCLWSTGSLAKALRHAALVLGLPVVNGEVPTKVIALVDAHKKLSKNDPATNDGDETGHSMLVHYRPYWLTLSEYCRLAHDHKLALVLAG